MCCIFYKTIYIIIEHINIPLISIYFLFIIIIIIICFEKFFKSKYKFNLNY